MDTRFILLTTQRSGSTWVVDMLNSHPSVTAYSELLLEEGDGTPKWGGAKDLEFWSTYRRTRRQAGETAPDRDLLVAYLDALYRPRPGIAATGFKLMYGQAAEQPALPEFLRSRGVAVAHLIRGNLLDTLISRWLALSGGVFHARDGAYRAASTVRLNSGELVDQLGTLEREIEAARQEFSSLGTRYLEVHYEDLAAERDRFGTLLDFLALEADPGRLTSRLSKIVDRDHRQIIENYDEVRAALEGSRFRSLLR